MNIVLLYPLFTYIFRKRMINLNFWLKKELLILLYEIGLSHLFCPLDFIL